MKSLAAILLSLIAAPAWADDLAFITSQNADEVSIVDLADGRIVAQIPVAGKPAPVAYDPKAGVGYVISAETGQLSTIGADGKLRMTKNLGNGAFGIALAPDGSIYVTDWYKAHLMRFDESLEKLWSVPTGKAPAGVALSRDGTLVATADRDDDQVSIFDATSGRRLRQVKTRAHPYALVFHDGKLWTTDVQSDEVSIIDPIKGQKIGVIKTGSHPYGIAFAGGKGFVTNQYAGTITVFDAATLETLSTLDTGAYPEGIAALPDGSGVVAVHWEDNTMVWIDAKTLKTLREIDLPDGPRAFGGFTGYPG